MTKNELKAKAWAKFEEAAAKARIKLDAVAAEAQLNTVKAGHVYMFKRQRCYIDWLVVMVHGESAFIVPRDHGYLEVGVLDIKGDVCVTRCNLGHWVNVSELLDNAILCDLDSAIEARELVRALFKCELPEVTEEADYITDTEEYQKRWRRIERCYSRCVGEEIW